MVEFTVENITDYNKITTSGWNLNVGVDIKKGNLVIIRGIPNLSKDEFIKNRATDRLRATLLGKKVVLKAAEIVGEGEIKCDVYINDVNVRNYFSDFK